MKAKEFTLYVAGISFRGVLENGEFLLSVEDLENFLGTGSKLSTKMVSTKEMAIELLNEAFLGNNQAAALLVAAMYEILERRSDNATK